MSLKFLSIKEIIYNIPTDDLKNLLKEIEKYALREQI
jgi:hypothetical protein